MTPDEIKIITALSGVTFFPGTKTKRLVQSLNGIAENNPGYNLTEKQRSAVLDIAVKFRRQIAADVVTLARKLKGEA